MLGSSCLRLGRLDEAKRFFREALRQAPATVNPSNAAAMLDNLAIVEKSMGHYAESLRLSHRSLLQHRRLNDTAGEALCLNNLGALYLDIGEFEPAREQLREGLALCERHGLVATRALILANLTELAVKSNDPDAAQFHAHRALEVVQATGNRALASWLKVQTASLALRRGDLAAARADLADGFELALALSRPAYIFAGLSCFADLLVAQGEPGCARQVLAFALAQAGIDAGHRDLFRVRLKSLPAPHGAEPPWPALDLEGLVHRVVAEASVAHAPLVAELRGARRREPLDAGAA